MQYGRAPSNLARCCAGLLLHDSERPKIDLLMPSHCLHFYYRRHTLAETCCVALVIIQIQLSVGRHITSALSSLVFYWSGL